MAYAPASPVYRPRPKHGDFVIYGLVGQMRTGELTVTLKNGRTKLVWIKRLGSPFDVDGQQCQYGYLTDPDERKPAVRLPDSLPGAAEPQGRGKAVSADADDFLPDGEWPEDCRESDG